MPGRCSVIGCKTTFKKGGTRLFYFPRQPVRKQAWIDICGREIGWCPSTGSRLCELHFDSHNFEENREDGWRKLKWNAIPSLFGMDKTEQDSRNGFNIGIYSAGEVSCSSPQYIDSLHVVIQKLRSGLQEFRELKYSEESDECISPAFREIEDPNFHNEEDVDPHPLEFDEIEMEDRQENEDFHSAVFKEVDVQKLLQENEDLQRKLTLKQRELWRAEKQISALKKKNSVLTNNIENLPFANEAFKQLFLRGYRKVPEWPPEVLKMALEIRYGVGGTGYKFLREKMKIPLPAYSTLYSHLEKIECEPGFLETSTSRCETDDDSET